MELGGRKVLVTGGGSGIGRAVALALAREGCRVAIAGRTAEKLRETSALWTGKPAIESRAADVSDRASVSRLFEWSARTLGGIEILVLAAGINIRRRSMAETAPEEWERVLAVNATGAFHCMQAALPAMRERGDGLVVNISSVAGKRASVLAGIAYSASKFAMTALGTAVALEEGPRGIRITNIYPGEVNTPILDARPEPVGPEARARILQPEDVASAVLMVAHLHPRAHVPELVIKPTHQPWA